MLAPMQLYFISKSLSMSCPYTVHTIRIRWRARFYRSAVCNSNKFPRNMIHLFINAIKTIYKYRLWIVNKLVVSCGSRSCRLEAFYFILATAHGYCIWQSSPYTTDVVGISGLTPLVSWLSPMSNSDSCYQWTKCRAWW